MNAKNLFSAITLALLFMVLSTGCSESTKEAKELPPLVSEIHFPYIKDSSFYAFDPETGNSELLATAETGLILALDIDESTMNSENNIKSFEHTISAEYFVYANSQTLHIYDIKTRVDHEVYSFKNDISFDPDTQELVAETDRYICDIQKIVTWDEEARLAKSVLYKDEFGVYVKTSADSDCTETTEPFSYWQINILESDETYTVRRNFLLMHSHKNNHFHDHDDKNYDLADLHGHDHDLETGELDENGQEFDQNDHEHNHEHQHSFIYGDEHAHDHLTKSDVDAIHNSQKNQEIKFETHPKLIGNKTSFISIDEALMYSGRPVIDIPNRNFGYLGFNQSESSYKFYSVKTETLDKSLLWELTLPNDNFDLLEFDYSNLNLSGLDKLSPSHNRFSAFQYVNNNVLITTKTKVIYFTLEELFDDDEDEARLAKIAEPLFTSNISEPMISLRTNYNSASNKMTITEDNNVWSIDFSTDANNPEAPELIKQFNEPNLVRLEASYFSNNILIQKHFLDEDVPGTSIILLQDNGIEDQTVLPRTFSSVSTTQINNEVFLNLSDVIFQSRTAEYYSTSLSSTLEYYDSIWSRETIDYRNNTQTNTSSIFSADLSASSPNTIESPKLYLFDKSDSNGQGEDFGYLQAEIKDVNKVIIFTDLYGFCEVTDMDSNILTYFFSNQKSSFNFDNELKNMKPL